VAYHAKQIITFELMPSFAGEPMPVKVWGDCGPNAARFPLLGACQWNHCAIRIVLAAVPAFMPQQQ
jgi:hypothetical protein